MPDCSQLITLILLSVSTRLKLQIKPCNVISSLVSVKFIICRSIMASPAWLPQEVQLSTSQAPVSAKSSHTPAEDIPTSKGPTGSSSDSTRESLQAASLTAPGYAVPALPFSYSGQQFHPSSVRVTFLRKQGVYAR